MSFQTPSWDVIDTPHLVLTQKGKMAIFEDNDFSAFQDISIKAEPVHVTLRKDSKLELQGKAIQSISVGADLALQDCLIVRHSEGQVGNLCSFTNEKRDFLIINETYTATSP